MENENKQIKASKWALSALFILSAVVLILFFCVGYGETMFLNNSNLTAPHYTGLLLIWMYALVVICAGTILGFGIVAGIKNMKYKTKGEKKTGFAGILFIVTAVIVVVSYFLASTEPVRLGTNELVTDAFSLKLTDVCLYSIYALVVISVICAILSMIGVFKSKK